MYRRTASAAVCALVLLCLVSSTGCLTTFGPSIDIGLASIPIPVSPFFQDQLEDHAWEQERYKRVAILGPLTAGGPAKGLDPPSDDEIIRALEKANPTEGGLPFLHEVQRNNVQIIVEPIDEFVDPIRVVPLVGPVQLHHAHYKCIINYTETTRVGWPIPYTFTDEDSQEVIYLDHDHFHMVGNVDGGPGSYY
ncbi:MAG TPA: hypothetical protein VMY42_03005 [Thermoguttaceae bacterium]|nr:hypothetical protein [Thermoguttaceae bacterium]